MLCTNCNKREAQMHFQSTVNGVKKEAHLCSECASEMGYPSIISGFQALPGNALGLPGMLSHLFSTETQKRTETTGTTSACSLCKTTAEDIGRTGRVGCARCYETFSSILTPYIRRIHGNTYHSGSIPKSAGTEILHKRKLEELSARLKEAVHAENFEEAAKLRDEIRELKKEAGE